MDLFDNFESERLIISDEDEDFKAIQEVLHKFNSDNPIRNVCLLMAILQSYQQENGIEAEMISAPEPTNRTLQ